MADIGVRVDSDSLVLWRGRDFRWTFENLDKNNKPIPFPPGQLYFELDTAGEHNARQIVRTLRANGGSMTLGVLGGITGALGFDSEGPDIQAALEALPQVGAGNVRVTGLYYPQWNITANFTGSAAVTFPKNVLGAINAAVRGVLNGLENLVGDYDLEWSYVPAKMEFTVTQRTGLTENELMTYIVDILNTSIQSVLAAIPQIGSGNVSVSQFYTPMRRFNVQFQGALSNMPIPPISAVSSLTGRSPEVDVDVVAPGKAPKTVWDFTMNGAEATIKVESEQADLVAARTPWQLVFQAEGEAAGGDPVGYGTVSVIGERR